MTSFGKFAVRTKKQSPLQPMPNETLLAVPRAVRDSMMSTVTLRLYRGKVESHLSSLDKGKCP